MVGMAEIKVTNETGDVLVAMGLGSCIGICAYDPVSKVAGMAHVVLPTNSDRPGEPPGKYANTAVPALLEAMLARGARAPRIKIALAGGAQLFSFHGNSSQLMIGDRNTEAALSALQQHNLPLIARDVGGSVGRTVHLFAADGRVRIKTIGQGERDLVLLSALDPALLGKAA